MALDTLVARLAYETARIGTALLERGREGLADMIRHDLRDDRPLLAGQPGRPLIPLPPDQRARLIYHTAGHRRNETQLLALALAADPPEAEFAADLINRLFLPEYAGLVLESEPRLIEKLVPLLQLRVAGAPEAAERELALLLSYPWNGQLLYAISLLEHESRRVRTQATAYLAQQGDAVREWMLSLLDHRSPYTRLSALLVLQRIGVDQAARRLQPYLERERTTAVKQQLADLVGLSWPAGEDSPQQRVAWVLAEAERVLPGRRKAPLSWCDPEAIAAPRWFTGTAVPSKVVRMLFVFQSYSGGTQLSRRVGQILPLIERGSGGPLAQALLVGWLERGTHSQEAWCLPLLCALGDESVVTLLVDAVKNTIRRTRVEMACRLLRATVYLQSRAMLRGLVEFSLEGRSRLIRQAASEVLSQVAAECGHAATELMDTTVPRPGFEAQARPRFDFGARHFYAEPDLQQGLRIVTQSGKELKALPRPGARDNLELANAAREQFRSCRTEVRRTLRLETQRLELALISRQSWSLEHWRRHFLSHPLLRLYAQSLVWGLLDEQARGYQALFRAASHELLIGVEGQPLNLPAQGRIRLVHMAELDEATRQAWARHQRDHQLVQPFPQIEREVSLLDQKLTGAREWNPCPDLLADEVRFTRAYSRAGWTGGRGLIVRYFEGFDIQAVQLLEHLGYRRIAGFRYAAVVRLQQLFFLRYRPGIPPADPLACRACALRLGDVPPIVLSEAAREFGAFAQFAALAPDAAAP